MKKKIILFAAQALCIIAFTAVSLACESSSSAIGDNEQYVINDFGQDSNGQELILNANVDDSADMALN